MLIRQFYIIFLFSIICASSSKAQLKINEVCSKNDTLITDEDGEYTDWIEIYNPGPGAYDLTGHHISSVPENPFEFNGFYKSCTACEAQPARLFRLPVRNHGFETPTRSTFCTMPA